MSALDPAAPIRSAPPELLRSVVVATELSARDDLVVARACSLPLAPDAVLTLVHVLSPRLGRRAARSRTRKDAESALAELVGQARRTLGGGGVEVRTELRVGRVVRQVASAARSAGAELVVVGRGKGPWEALLGCTAERLTRVGVGSVLVVRKGPVRPYRRPLVAIELDEGAIAVIRFALRVLPHPPPPMRVVHAFDVPFETLRHPDGESIERRAYRRQHRVSARQAVERLLEQALARAYPRAVTLKRGGPRRAIARESARRGPDLLVLGTRRRAGLECALLGSVAGDVLRDVVADTLLVGG